jgi:hypothetical protein
MRGARTVAADHSRKATRNVADFASTALELVTPWDVEE